MEPQAWIYQQDKPTAGRKLLLLEEAELIFAFPLIYRLINPEAIASKPDWFCGAELQTVLYTELVTQLNELVQLRKKARRLDNELMKVNKMLNQYFTDLGWRMVRKELSQIKKRQKKSHIEVSRDIILRLKRYMESQKLDSFDQAIDNLLSEHDADNSQNHLQHSDDIVDNIIGVEIRDQ
ncbi:hypothetical protein AYJ58_13595 [Shewanella sp. Pdp11]|uniref:hypothetical protein n=1 Tax=Shewanella sp. Pdp11 TaxID=2059264 RepID=UPI000CA3EE75|nr:hypothetical protein [Shewanella sp. Pdp11]AUD60451.1 hypothetical protein AYJ58_13595 [Shewanella sp. Pdp11]